MANIHTILDALLDYPPGTRFNVDNIETRNEYETIRTRLVTLWTSRRTILLAIDADSSHVEKALCGDWCKEENKASFYLGETRRKQSKTYSFSIETNLGSKVTTNESSNTSTPLAGSSS